MQTKILRLVTSTSFGEGRCHFCLQYNLINKKRSNNIAKKRRKDMLYSYEMWAKGYVLPFMLLIIMTSISLAQDPNADPNWDWRAGDNPAYTYPGTEYKLYTGAIGAYIFIKSPWAQFNAPDMLGDNKKEDGWVLLIRDFGTSTRPAAVVNSPAYFALYNKQRSILRAFLLVKANANFTTGSIIMQFGSNTKTATLTHLYPRAYATDNQAAVQDNHASALTNTVADGFWVWGDFPMAFDPTIVATSNPDCPRLYFQVIGTTETSIKLSGTATGIGGTYKNARDFLSGGSNGLGVVAASEAMPTTVGSTMNFSTLKSKVFGTSNDWNSWKTSLNDVYKNLGVREGSDPLSVASNNLALAIGSIKDSWVVSNFPVIGAAVGLIDFLFGGGGTDPAKTGPTYFAFNLNLEGSAVTNFYLGTGASIQVPAAKSNPTVPCYGSSVPLLYNNPVGVFNLTKSPKLQVKKYYQAVPGCTIQCYRTYYDYQVKDELQYQVNPSAGLVLDSVRAWIVMDPSINVNASQPFADQDLKLLAQRTQASLPQLRLESTINNQYVFSSIPVDGRAFRFQTIQGPEGKFLGCTQSGCSYQDGWTSDMTIKLKVVLHRQDNPSTVPVVMVLTYEPDIEFVTDGSGNVVLGNWPAPPTPVVTSISSGWNMLSVPNVSYDYVAQVSNFSKSYVFAGASSSAFAYDGGYVAKDPVSNGPGYWVKYDNARNITYFGTMLNPMTVNVKAGWNMIGSISQTFPTDKIKSYIVQNGVDVETPGNVVSNYFGYLSGYQTSFAIEAGKGYWVKVAADGKLKLDLASLSAVPPGITPEQPPQLPDAPPIPTLASPVNGSTNRPLSLTLYWNASTGATSYRLQLATDAGFTSLVSDISGITTTSQQVSGLAYSTTYYWKVRAANDITSSNWSDIWWFTTQNPPPPPDPCGGIMSAQSLDAFTVTDANGNSQQLYTRNAGRDLHLGKNDDQMPPKPIPGAFDSRFGSGRLIEPIPPTGATVKIPLLVQDGKFPLRLSWNIVPENNARYWLSIPGSSVKKEMKGAGSAQIDQASGGVIIQAQASRPCDPTASTVSSRETMEAILPSEYALEQNYPNPFNPSTDIAYALPEVSHVKIVLYDILGQEVLTLVDEVQVAGYQSTHFDGSSLPSGVYFYLLKAIGVDDPAKSFMQVKKMILAK
jgi:hypothetical protein